MPSKAGRRRGQAARHSDRYGRRRGPASQLRPCRAGSPSAPRLRGRTLQPAARRQAELTEPESDELYASRLRRLMAREGGLQRALVSGGEEEMRNAISEQERRLAEVRAFEERFARSPGQSLRSPVEPPSGLQPRLGQRAGRDGLDLERDSQRRVDTPAMLGHRLMRRPQRPISSSTTTRALSAVAT
jgi:hypothetical protein